MKLRSGRSITKIENFALRRPYQNRQKTHCAKNVAAQTYVKELVSGKDLRKYKSQAEIQNTATESNIDLPRYSQSCDTLQNEQIRHIITDDPVPLSPKFESATDMYKKEGDQSDQVLSKSAVTPMETNNPPITTETFDLMKPTTSEAVVVSVSDRKKKGDQPDQNPSKSLLRSMETNETSDLLKSTTSEDSVPERIQSEQVPSTSAETPMETDDLAISKEISDLLKPTTGEAVVGLIPEGDQSATLPSKSTMTSMETNEINVGKETSDLLKSTSEVDDISVPEPVAPNLEQLIPRQVVKDLTQLALLNLESQSTSELMNEGSEPNGELCVEQPEIYDDRSEVLNCTEVSLITELEVAGIADPSEPMAAYLKVSEIEISREVPQPDEIHESSDLKEPEMEISHDEISQPEVADIADCSSQPTASYLDESETEISRKVPQSDEIGEELMTSEPKEPEMEISHDEIPQPEVAECPSQPTAAQLNGSEIEISREVSQPDEINEEPMASDLKEPEMEISQDEVPEVVVHEELETKKRNCEIA